MDWDEEERILFDLLERELTEAAQMGGQALTEQLRRYGGVNIGIDWSAINEAGRAWIMAYGEELAKQITATTQEQVRNAIAAFHATPGMTRGQLEQLIMEGPDGIPDLVSHGRIIPAARRAEMIAVTEITRSYSGGEVATMQALDVPQVAPERQPPAHVGCRCDISPFTREDGVISWKWLSLSDGLVCPVCRALHGKDVGAQSPKGASPMQERLHSEQAEQTRAKLNKVAARYDAESAKLDASVEKLNGRVDAAWEEMLAVRRFGGEILRFDSVQSIEGRVY